MWQFVTSYGWQWFPTPKKFLPAALLLNELHQVAEKNKAQQKKGERSSRRKLPMRHLTIKAQTKESAEAALEAQLNLFNKSISSSRVKMKSLLSLAS